MTHALRPFVLPLSLLAFALALGACKSEEIGAKNIVIGESTLEQIEPGTGRRFVLALLGEPMLKTPLEDERELWIWGYRLKESAGGSTVLIIDNAPRTERSHAAYVELDKGRVVRAWRD